MLNSLKAPATAGIVGAVISAVIAGMLNYYVIPFPESVAGNAIGHSIDGFIGAFISGFVGVATYQKRSNALRNAAQRQ